MQRDNLKIQNSNFQIPAQIIGYVILLLFLLPFAADAATLRTPPNNLGLVGYWSMEDGSGSTATDFSGSGNAGTLTNIDASTDWVSGKRGTALDFDGSDDRVDTNLLPSDVGIAGSSNVTITAWTNPDSFNDGGVWEIGTQDDGNEFSMRTQTSESQWRAQLWGSYDIDFTTGGKGEWVYITLVQESGTTKVYVDGQLKASRDQTINIEDSDGLYIGRWDNHSFNGKIDEVRIYNRALSASEVRDLYRSGYAEINRTAKVEEVGDPVGWWTFDGKDMDFSGSGTSTDRSGNGNDGSLEGGMSNADSKPGRIGQALEFDGNDDLIEIPDRATPASVTVSAWVKWDGDSQKANIASGGFKSTPDTTEWELRVYSDGSVDWSTWDGDAGHGFRPSSYTLPTDTWTHVTGIYDAADEEYRLYIDGSRKDTQVDSYGPADADNDAPWSIGAVYDNRSGFLQHFDGKIDDVRIYDQALSADEIQKIYDATRPSEVNASQSNELTDGLVGMWSFDGPSMDFGGSPPTAADVSSNSNTATLNGGMASAIGNIGQALEFDGNDDYINIGSVGGNVNTFSFWTKPTKDNQYITQLNGSTNIQLSSGSIQANGFSSPTIYVDGQNTSSVTIGEWNHVTITTDSAVNASSLQSGAVDGVGDPTPSYINTSVFGPKDVSNGETINFSHRNSGSDRMLLISTIEITGGSSNIDSVEYGGNSLSQVVSETLVIGSLGLTNTIWRLDSPPIGDNNAAVTFGGSANNVEIAASSFSHTGGIGATKTNNTGGTADSISTAITPNSADSLVLDSAASVGGTTAGENQVVRWTINQHRGSTQLSDGSNLTMSWTNDDGNAKTQVISEILPASSNPPAYFAGKMDNIRMYDRALSEDEIKRLYRLGQ